MTNKTKHLRMSNYSAILENLHGNSATFASIISSMYSKKKGGWEVARKVICQVLFADTA
jgi:hypothetical protein